MHFSLFLATLLEPHGVMTSVQTLVNPAVGESGVVHWGCAEGGKANSVVGRLGLLRRGVQAAARGEAKS